MKKILAWIGSLVTVGGLLLSIAIFHPVILILNKTGGTLNAFKAVFSVSYITMQLGRIFNFASFKFINHNDSFPENTPFIIISNHQSFYDIAFIAWYFRKLGVRFVAKKELSKGLPTVSYYLRIGGGALIDRNNPEQSIKEIKKLAEVTEKEKSAVCIYPEGSRSRKGGTKKFKVSGTVALIESMPTAKIIPVSIENSWKLLNFLPMPLGVKCKITAMPIIDPKKFNSPEAIIGYCEEKITTMVNNNQNLLQTST